jgi:hypothetical protein
MRSPRSCLRLSVSRVVASRLHYIDALVINSQKHWEEVCDFAYRWLRISWVVRFCFPTTTNFSLFRKIPLSQRFSPRYLRFETGTGTSDEYLELHTLGLGSVQKLPGNFTIPFHLSFNSWCLCCEDFDMFGRLRYTTPCCRNSWMEHLLLKSDQKRLIFDEIVVGCGVS